MIRFIDGDILTPPPEDEFVVICHQVNCMGVMGAGLAKQIRDKFPENFREYKKLCSHNYNDPESLLGKTSYGLWDSDHVTIANLFGQLGYGTNKRQTDYDALRNCIKKVMKDARFLREHRNINPTVRIPYGMGAGLGGGDWDTILMMITIYAGDNNVEIWKLR